MTMDDKAAMSGAGMNDLPDSDFAYIEPGGKKDSGGKTVPRSLRHFPIHDAAHVRNALSRAPQSPFGPKAMPKIMAAAKKMGIGQKALGELKAEPMNDEPLDPGCRGRSLDECSCCRSAAPISVREVRLHDGRAGPRRRVLR